MYHAYMYYKLIWQADRFVLSKHLINNLQTGIDAQQRIFNTEDI